MTDLANAADFRQPGDGGLWPDGPESLHVLRGFACGLKIHEFVYDEQPKADKCASFENLY
jgi:hypothetical protein